MADLVAMAEVPEHSLRIIAQHLANIPLSTVGEGVGSSPGRGGCEHTGPAGFRASCGPSLLLPEAAWGTETCFAGKPLGVGQLGALRLSAHGGGVTPVSHD